MRMKYRKAVFMAVYCKTKKGIEYLIFKRKLHWKGWEFPKGGVEDGENSDITIKRELKEETGLKNKDVLLVKDFKISGKYKYNKKLADRMGYIGQTYHLYLIRVNKKKIKPDNHEHSKAEWVNYKTALQRLTWKNQKKCLKSVNDWLNKMKFREVELNSGNVVLIGKNKEQNEKLVKEFIGKDNLIMHTVASGSPFCVALKKPSAKEKKQIAELCAVYSQDWRDNKQDVKVHVFTGKNVHKRKGMKVGTFGVKKTKIIITKKQDIKKWQKNK